jgi:hypothetical protein
MQLLRTGASGEAIVEHLSRVEEKRMGFRTTPERLRPVGERIVRWHTDSVADWEAAHPT